MTRTTREPESAALESALCDPTLADRVEMVLSSPQPDTYRAAAHDGAVEFTRSTDNGNPEYRRTATSGRDPLADQSTDRFLGLGTERSNSFPAAHDNAYPFAFDSVAQFFDAPVAPDLVALHSASHHYGGHLGQHGSLGTVQARAPFIAGGAGIAKLGVVDQATRVVNVAPTIARLLGVEANVGSVGPTGERLDRGLLRRQDGTVESEVLDGTRPDHVVVFLLDGCNPNLLAAAMADGEAPNIGSVLSDGMSFGRGSMASLPTATLANHTTSITGAHPGHSGILHNAWVDRADGDTVDLLELPAMFHAMQHLSPDVETLFQALHRSRPSAFSSASFEFCDTGADFSTFALVRRGDESGLPPTDTVTHLDPDASANEPYRFMSRVDHLSTAHTLQCWRREHGNPLPTLSWCSLALTDEAGHTSGPHGELARAAVRDSDARVGDVLAAVESAGALDDTAVLVIADHGMEQCDPEVDEGWDQAVAESGVACREVGDGLIYLG
ncbi:MAG: hypothetical protein GY812_11480 [Actinomycetia bacterium]|nr:hypothetical protein [Actinomycetes bacterium]